MNAAKNLVSWLASRPRPPLVVAVVSAVTLLNAVLFVFSGSMLAATLVLVGSCYLFGRWYLAHPLRMPVGQPTVDDLSALAPAPTPVPAVRKAKPSNGTTNSLVDEMLESQRYALLLRPQVASNLTPEECQRSRTALEDGMAIVPSGEVSLNPDDQQDDGVPGEGTRVWVDCFFLDRYLVTNAEFQQFVDARGYEQTAIWDPAIWPAVLHFTDRTGQLGPRFWKNGRHLPGEERLPVIGLCWHEAAAYARWVGKRLPTDAEWTKAASWPVPLSATVNMQRRYPWGDAMDRNRCNLWGGPGRPVSVTELAEGLSVGGVYQMIGNVWEWALSDFGAGRDLLLPTPMKSIRGGAFDTYFDNQATCQFQSGENPLARKHNIGFRCAVSACDLNFESVNAEPVAHQAEPAEALSA